MADDIKFSITGLEPVLAKMAEVKLDIRKKGGRYALRKAAAVVLESAKQNALKVDDPATAQSIEKNLAMRFGSRRFKATGDLMFRVGVMGGSRQYSDTKDNRRKQRVGESYHMDGSSGNPGGDTFYWRFVELGTSRQRAQPFLRPALEQNINRVIDVFATEYDNALGRAIRRANRVSKKR